VKAETIGLFIERDVEMEVQGFIKLGNRIYGWEIECGKNFA